MNTPTRSYRFEFSYDVDFEATNDIAAHGIAASIQERGQESVGKAYAGPHRVYSRRLRLAARGPESDQRILRDSEAEDRGRTNWQRIKARYYRVATELSVFGWTAIAVWKDDPFFAGFAALAAVWCVRDVVADAVVRKMKHG